MDINSIDPSSLDVAHKVNKLSFRFYTESETLRFSVRRLTSQHAFDDLGRPIPRGLYDPVLGPTSQRDGPCLTCGLFYQSCPGHFGHIELPFPIPNPLLSGIHLRLLRASCASCYRLLHPKSDLSLLLARLYFEDAGLPRSAFAVEAYRALRKSDTSSRQKSATSALDQGFEPASHPLITNWPAFLEALPYPISRFLAGINPNDSALIERNILRAARIAWKRARREGGLASTRPKGWRETMATIFSPPMGPCPECFRESVRIRRGERDKLFRPSSRGGDEVLLSPLEIERQISALWGHHTELCDLMFGLKGRRNKTEDRERPHRRLFVKNVLVPPSRFRPTSAVNNMEYAAEHPQNIFFQRLLTEISVILDANEFGLEGDVPAEEEEEDGEDSDEPVVNRPTKARFAQAMVNLQDALCDLYDSSQAQGSQSTGIRQQLEAKAGLFRQHMMGKRVNYSCRSVIGPDVFLDTDEIGIPESFAKLLSVPEPVIPSNLEQMQKAVLNGPAKYPGALAVEDLTSTGDFRIVKFHGRTSSQILQSQAGLLLQNRAPKPHGYHSNTTVMNGNHGQTDNASPNVSTVPKRVHRHLKTGDVVLFNRQPTLHRVSIMAHRVRVLPGERTIRFHYANCNSYNADFDGDEMNVHVPQDFLSRTEAEELMLSSKHYVVPTSGAPIRGLIQDHIAASTLLSKRDTFLDRPTFMQLLYSATEKLMLRPDRANKQYELPIPAILKPINLWTGKQLFSTILSVVRNGRPGLNLHGGTKTKPNIIGKEESSIIVRNGELLQGIVDKNSLGSSMYGIVHAVQEAYGCTASDDFLSCLSRLLLFYMRTHGHTTGVADLILQDHGNKKRNKILRKGINTIGIEMANSVSLEMSNQESADDVAAKTDEEARRLIEEMVRKDGAEAEDRLDSAMKTALNQVASSVMKACVPVALKRPFPENGFALMTNTGAKGSAVNAAQISCLLGSTVLEGKRVPRMGGSGATLPCFMPYDPSPIAGGFIASRFLTGITPQEFFFHAMSGREGLLDTSLKTANSGYLQRCLVKHLEGIRLHYDGTVRDADDSLLQFIYGDDGVDPCKSRWLTDKINWQIKNKKCLKRPSEPTHRDVLSFRKQERSIKSSMKPEKDVLLELLSPAALSKRGAISEKFNSVIEDVETGPDGKDGDIRDFLEGRYQAAAVEPGEGVGVLAGQGVGEPSTQMTLNTFHHAGSSSAHVTLGIPRLRELLMTASKYPKTPSMTLPIISSDKKEGAEKLRRRLQNVSLIDLMLHIEVRETSIFFSPALADGAIRKVAIGLYLPEEEVYQEPLGFSFDFITSIVSNKFIIVLNDLLKKEAIRLLKQGGPSTVEVARTYLKVCQHPERSSIVRQIERKGESSSDKDGSKDRTEEITTDDEVHAGKDNGSGDLEEGSSSGEEDDDEDESDEDNTKTETGVKVEDFEDAGRGNENKAPKTKRKPKKPQKKMKDDKMEIDSSEEEGDDSAFFGSLGFVMDSTKGVNRRIIEFDWALPVFFSGSIDLANAVQEAAASTKIAEVNMISRCFVSEDGDKYDVITEGSNLPEIFEHGSDLVDFDRVETNDMYGILQTYGVEAMRAALIKEFVKVFEAYGIPVNIRHLQLIADYMTVHGGYRGFNRAAMQDAPSPLQKMTFETSVKFLTEAALNSTEDNLRNPSSAIALGQMCETGTGGFQLMQRVK